MYCDDQLLEPGERGYPPPVSRWGHGPSSALYRWPQCHRKTEWQALLSKLTVACACTQRVVSPGVCHFYRTILSSIKNKPYLLLSRTFNYFSVAFLNLSSINICSLSQLCPESLHLDILSSSDSPDVKQAKPLRLALVIMSWTPHKNVMPGKPGRRMEWGYS